MARKVSFGKDTLHGGKKMSVYEDDFGRSSFNQTKTVKTTMSAGTLVPVYVNFGTKGDTFDIDIETIVKTKPAISPLFGTFKMQVDLFICPVRLYNGLLHMDDTNIGMDMGNVYFPQIEMSTSFGYEKLSNSSIMTYLGLRGFGNINDYLNTKEGEVLDTIRTFTYNALPILGYIDIVKCYYTNRQETNCYYVTAGRYSTDESYQYEDKVKTKPIIDTITMIRYNETQGENENFHVSWEEIDTTKLLTATYNDIIILKGTDLDPSYFGITNDGKTITGNQTDGNVMILGSGHKCIALRVINPITIDKQSAKNPVTYFDGYKEGLKLKPLPLSSLDKLRVDILRFTQRGTPMVFNGNAAGEYGQYFRDICGVGNTFGSGGNVNEYTGNYCCNEQNGLFVKTYQNDMFNNWLKTEYFDQISEMSAVTVEANKIKIDDIILQRKIYDMMNRVAVSGGSLQDWEQARYGGKEKRWIESPMYMGGLSCEIGFDEVVSTSETSTEKGGDQALGTLAGKGGIIDKNGGNVKISLDEACFIIGIASITPRVDYHQGNAWYLNELKTMNDLHAPELDQIGFQNLMQREMAYFTEQYGKPSDEQLSAGKTPAWINYMSAVDEVFGDLADIDKMGSMVLLRNYEEDVFNPGEITDLTTYIDPVKFNYAFADTDYDAMNFICQFKFNVTSRRVMSAKVMPNL